MWFVVVVLVTAFVGSSVAPAPCSDLPDIQNRLKTIPECYEGGKHPAFVVEYGMLHGLSYISAGALPEGTKCVTGTQIEGKGIIYLKKDDDNIKELTYKLAFQDGEDYIHEEDAKGMKYQVWPIRNKNHVYFYYKCIATPGEKGSGKTVAGIFVQLGQSQNKDTLAEVEKANACVKKLGMGSLIKVEPCH